MASPSVTYTFSNGTAADATQVNQNFTDVINGITDGTKDLSISALTLAGTFTANGNVTLGNSSVDDITITGSIAASIPFKTNASFDLGASTSGVRALYIGSSGSFTTGILSGATASHTYTLPATQGSAGSRLENNGSGVLTWSNASGIVATSSKTANYTATTADDTLFLDGSGGAFTVTLYTAVGNTGRKLTFVRTDNTLAEQITIDGNSTETIRGVETYKICSQYEALTIISDGTNWQIERQYIPGTRSSNATITITGSTSNPTKATSPTKDQVYWERDGAYAVVRFDYQHGAATGTAAGSGDYIWALPTGLTVDTTKLPAYSGLISTAADEELQDSYCGDGHMCAATARGYLKVFLASSTTVKFVATNSFSSINVVASGFLPITNADYGITAIVRVPISGWES